MMPRFFRSKRKSAPTGRACYRPSLDPLEDRSLPSVAASAPIAPAGATPPVSSPLPEATNFAPSRAVTTLADIPVAVMVNAPATTIDLNALFAAAKGIDLTLPPGPAYNVLSNTNTGLVTARLSDDNLILTYAPGQTGTAKVTVGATDASGAAVRVTFVVTVSATAPPH